jgi:hypothetical protein
MHLSNFKEIITFQKSTDDGETYTDFLTTHAYMNGMTTSEFLQTKSGNEFYMDFAGTEGQLITTIVCRYQKALAAINPMQYRVKHTVGDEETFYQLLTPPDDVQLKHERIKFRARRIYTLDDEQEQEGDEIDEEGTPDESGNP